MVTVARALVRVILAGSLFVLGLAFPAWAQSPITPAPPPAAPGQPATPAPPAPVPGEQPAEEPEAEVPEEPEALRPVITVPEEPIERPAGSAPPSFLGPDLFNPPAPRGWITFTPSITLSEEFTDNVGRAPRDREWDFITSAIPGFTLSMQRPNYRLVSGYNVTGDLYARANDASGFGKRQQLFADGFYQFNPRTRLSVSERFILDRESQGVTSSGISAGERDAWRNTLSARLGYQATQLTGLGITASHTMLRYDPSGGSALDSDTYRLALGATHRFTPRLVGGANVESAYFDVKGEASSFTETPRLTASYRITPRLTAFASAGPSMLFRDGETEVDVAATGRLSYALTRLSSVEAGYDRAFAAETVGVTRRDSFYALGRWNLSRRLRAELTPRYTIVAANDVAATSEIKVLTVNVRANYQIARFISLIASYTYVDQRGENRSDDIYENRVFLGLQYAYPINFE